MAILIYGMVFVGSALMVYNIYSYIRYLRQLLAKGYWDSGRQRLYFPLILLIMFLVGYLLVGFFGKPDIIMSGILFFGSVYVTIILGVLQHITERVQESEELKTELRAAEESARAKTRFLSHMSHEIRTPMNAIIGLNTLAMKNPDLPDQTRQQMEKIDASSQHLLELINDILDISRIESGTVEIKNDPFRMKDLIRQVGGIVQAQCDDKGLDYEFRSEGPVKEAYKGDMMKLKQCVINLLGNAVKFTPQGGRIVFTVRGEEPAEGRQILHFVVTDNGIGIDEEFLPHLFDIFRQEDDSSTGEYGGSGLGLAITRSLIDLMGGEIRVESRKGRGTTFTIDMTLTEADLRELEETRDPRGPEETGPAETEALAKAGPDPSRIHLEGRYVLFAEDIELNAEILGDLLEMEDIRSDWASNGQVAVDKFASSEPFTYDAILMDLRMPVMDGLTAAGRIRELDRPDAGRIPIIALTANAFKEDVEACISAGMNAHLSKPVDSDLLYEKLRLVIAERDQDNTWQS